MAKNESKNENKVKKHFFKDFKAELKKVIWPTPNQVVNNTVAVVTIVFITAVIVFVLDAVFDLGNKYGITSLQNIVNEKFNNDEEKDANNTTNVENSGSVENQTSENNDTTNQDGDVEDTTTNNTGNTTENVEQ